ncbi:MAG: hypothetical protein JJLCMIEE_02349 [Acidimicrobiales bacterium]|nr:MAG: hypothetical protein EDR02_14140 [Actinomycetota bacterium]MBV6509280.1 hypothetical protein [Acidimicrobiales bacterium]RIK03993.1 MAG: hypothetical protein DCC48_14915 [Acidobacteriota bacterium]
MTKAMKALAVLFAGFLFLAACGDDDGGENTTTTEDSGSDDTSSDDTSSDDTSSDDTSSDDTSSDDTSSDDTAMGSDYEPENSEEDIAAVIEALNASAGSSGFPSDDPYTVCFADQLIVEYGGVDEAVGSIESVMEVSEGDFSSLEDINFEEFGMEWLNASITCADVMLGDLGEELEGVDEQMQDIFGE